MNDGTLLGVGSELLIQAGNAQCVGARENCEAQGGSIRKTQWVNDIITGAANRCQENLLCILCSGCACGHQNTPPIMNRTSVLLYVRVYQSQNDVLK